MKFRYYITDLFDGCIKGTNELEVAQVYATCEDFYVVDTETSKWLSYDGNGGVKEIDIQPARAPQ